LDQGRVRDGVRAPSKTTVNTGGGHSPPYTNTLHCAHPPGTQICESGGESGASGRMVQCEQGRRRGHSPTHRKSCVVPLSGAHTAKGGKEIEHLPPSRSHPAHCRKLPTIPSVQQLPPRHVPELHWLSSRQPPPPPNNLSLFESAAAATNPALGCASSNNPRAKVSVIMEHAAAGPLPLLHHRTALVQSTVGRILCPTQFMNIGFVTKINEGLSSLRPCRCSYHRSDSPAETKPPGARC
jgi:hypothetical protein